MRKSLFASLLMASATAIAGIGTAEAETWRLSHVRPQGTAIDTDVNWFAGAVAEATDGAVEVDVYAASALGDYTTVQERVGLGAVQMAVQPPATGVDKRFQIAMLPYLAENWTQAQEIFGAGSPMREVVGELYGEQDIRVLAAWPVYFGGISLNTEPVAPGDPDVAQGIKLRVPPIKSFQLLADNLGYIGSPLPFSEAFTAVQTGVVDGVIGSGAEGYYASFRDVTQHYLPINTHFEIWYLIVNEQTFQDLDEEQQAALEAVAAEFEARRWAAAEEAQSADEQRLAEYGATIIEVTPEQIDAMAEKVRANVWPEILDDIGADWGQGVLNQVFTN